MPNEPPSQAQSGIPRELTDVLARFGRGELPANVALMQLIMRADAPQQVSDAVRAATMFAAPSTRIRAHALLKLWSETPDAWNTVKGIFAVRESGHQPEHAVRCWTSFFDRAATKAADSAAALYALGRADLLDIATREVLAHLQQWRVLSHATHVLEIGCGTGRFVAPLARAGYLAIGIDTSFAMLQHAMVRCRDLQSAVLMRTSGRDLSMFADSTFDAVLAIDSFPYIVAAGHELAEAHVREAARVLRAQGWLVILNYSYRGDPAADARDAERLAAVSDLTMVRSGTRDFGCWDAQTYVMRKS